MTESTDDAGCLYQRVRVMEVRGGKLVVEVDGNGNCAACAAGKGCGNAWLGRLFRASSPMLIDGCARPGDRLLLKYPSGVLEKRAAWLYGVLLGGLLIGGLSGHVAGLRWAGVVQDLLAALGGVAGMVFAVHFLRRHFAARAFPRPTIIELLPPAPSTVLRELT